MTATLAPPAKVRSAESSSSAPITADLAVISEANAAWMLADAVDACLTGHEYVMTFVELGCGEDYLAIERILNAVISNRMMLPVAVFDTLTRWLDGYAGSPEELQLRTMVANVRAQQPVPLWNQQTQCGDSRRAVCSISVAR